MDFITAPLIVGIITLGIYKLFELFACRRERITLIEKLGEKMSQTDLELNGKICLPDFNRPQLSFGALKGGCLLLGVGLGLLVGFILSYVSFSLRSRQTRQRVYPRDGWGHLRFVYPSFRRSRISGLFPDRTELCSEKEREIKNNPRNAMPAIDVSPNIRI